MPSVSLIIANKYPELVAADAQRYKRVDCVQLTPVLLEALKKQQAQIEYLQT